jgi:tRNA threonylcarbamoyladenosine biosynthesis protein TsaE
MRDWNFWRRFGAVPEKSITQEFITQSAEETIAWGRQLASGLKAPVLILLSGDLGSGKTTLTKGIVSALGAAREDDVTSPTFTLLHAYGEAQPVFHGDLYRIENFHDFETLGMEDLFAKPAIVILEWSERFPLPSPWPEIRIRLEHLGGDLRRIAVLNSASSEAH